MTDDAASSPLLTCHRPAMDPTQRLLMPVGLVGLLAFMLLWLGSTASFVLHSARVLHAGERIDAEIIAAPPDTAPEQVRNGVTARALDDSGQAVLFAPPKGTELSPGHRFTVLRWDQGYVLPDTARSDLIIASAMTLFGLIPLFIGRHAWKQLQSDRRRLEALQRSAIPMRPSSVRVARERPQRRRRQPRPDWYRVWAEFEYGGQRYEAPGELQQADPGTPDPATLRVRVLTSDPLQSMLLDASPTVPAHLR